MANTKDILASSGKVAAGGAGAAAGTYFSFELFKDLDVPSLLRGAQVYGLTVLFFVAAIILSTGYAALPIERQQNLREILTRVVPALLVLSLGGYVFQMWQEARVPPKVDDPAVSLRVKFFPKMTDLNQLIGSSEPANSKFNASLSVEVDDPAGTPTDLNDGVAHKVDNLHKDQLLQIMIPNLERYVLSAHQSHREAALCGNQSCDAAPAGAPF